MKFDRDNLKDLLDSLYPFTGPETQTNSCKGIARQAFVNGRNYSLAEINELRAEVEEYKKLYFDALVTQQKAEKTP